MDEPWIHQASPTEGPNEAIVYAKGYLTDRSDSEEGEQRWVDSLRQAGWRGAVYHLWWDASNWRGLIKPWNWWKVKSRAKRVGIEHLEALVDKNVPEKKVSLLGHSMGARVTYHAVLNAPRCRFENAILLGGAIRRDSSRDWGQVADRLNGLLVNVYNNDDVVLTLLAKTIYARQNPCGRKPIKAQHDKIVDREDPGSGNHSHYRRHLGETVAPVLWQR